MKTKKGLRALTGHPEKLVDKLGLHCTMLGFQLHAAVCSHLLCFFFFFLLERQSLRDAVVFFLHISIICVLAFSVT